ncbi:unnamed protein product, partial [Effrenium voratum]
MGAAGGQPLPAGLAQRPERFREAHSPRRSCRRRHWHWLRVGQQPCGDQLSCRERDQESPRHFSPEGCQRFRRARCRGRLLR